MDLIQIQFTCPSLSNAKEISKTLVEKGLVACAQIDSPISSIYQWEGKIEEANEWRVIAKTIKSKYAAVEKSILEIHPYEVPQIIALPILLASSDYKEWVIQNTTKK